MGEQPERWCVHLLITRDPRTEGRPEEWDWDSLMEGGDPVVLSAVPVGYVAAEEQETA